jgi:hypothetical protein
MQSVGTYTAEDSSFIKYQSQNAGDKTSVVSPVHDVEKAEVKGTDCPITGPPAIVTRDPQNVKEKGVFDQSRTSGSDGSSLAAPYDDKDDFPEGGLRGWSVVVGAFCGSFSVFGIINSTAILLDFFSEHQLKGYTPSQIGWIFGLALFLTFFCGAPIGPIFDSYGPRVLIFCGSILLVASMFLLGLCTRM